MDDLTGLSVRRVQGRGPVVMFLSGYASDMTGSKALALDDWAVRTGRAFVRFDYRGCGESAGAFEDFTLEDWRDDALNIIDATEGPLVLVGSSMGGWIMLLAALARSDRVAGLIGIAAAPDFTQWGFSTTEKAAIMHDGRLGRPSDYGGTMTTTAAFWQSGNANVLLSGAISIDGPVRLLHGQADPDVPWNISLQLAARLRSGDVQTILVKDGDHRLSRPQDIALLIATVERVLDGL